MNWDAIVIGGGIGGLNSALQLARSGLKPLVVEARGRCGGLVVGAPLAGRWIDIGAESYARRSTYCVQLCSSLGLATREPGGGSWVWSAEDQVFPLPYGVLGIPASLTDPQVIQALSKSGLNRAQADLTMGDAGSDVVDLASLVRLRLGEEVYQTLVRPVASGIYSAEGEDLSVDVIIPGLRAAMCQTGSLVAAAAQLRSAAPSGAVVSSVVGGLFRLPQAMIADIQTHDGEVWTKTIVTNLSRESGQWVVTCAQAIPGLTPADPPIAGGDRQELRTKRVIVAADGRAGMNLLNGFGELGIDDWQLPQGGKVAHVVLAIRHPELSTAPRGAGLLVAPRKATGLPIKAKALTHLSVKWPWLLEDQDLTNPMHYLRVSYGRPGEDPHPSVEQGIKDGSQLLGIPLIEGELGGSMLVHWNDSLPPPTPKHRERVAEMFDRISALPGLGVTGAWVAGNGLASVLPHAHGEANRIAKW